MERFARDALDKLFWAILPAVLVDIGAEPLADEAKLSLRDAGLPVRMGLFKGMEELGSVEVAKDIGGEVTDESKAPMDVLEAPFKSLSKG